MIKEPFNKTIEKSIKKNWSMPALSDYQGRTVLYGEIAREIVRLHILFEKENITKGDKIALIGKNSINWGIVYLAVVTYGAIIVPILPDFLPEDASHIINHSDSKILFVAENIWKKLNRKKIPRIKDIFALENLKIIENSQKDLIELAKLPLPEILKKQKKENLSPELLAFPEVSNGNLAEISYTSGTTGFSKGVMLEHNSLAANIQFAQNNMPLNPGDSIVSFLPLAHAYGCAFEFLFPFSFGCHITFLTKTPSPQIIVKAFNEIKPRLILSVPLVIEKVYKKQVVPSLRRPPIKFLLKIPVINNILYISIRKKLAKAFGGNFKEMVIGGAAFNPTAEAFFKKIHFPYSVGYGMTECGPLISYAPWKKFKAGSAGIGMNTLEVKIDSLNPQKIVGEIMVKGENVMVGYYKNEEATKSVLDDDGWLRTGDLGIIDEDGFVFIKGRNKSMILGPSGQNIYPEEIESLLNARQLILESVVIEKNNKLVALVCPDEEMREKRNISPAKMEEMIENYREEINNKLPQYLQVKKFIIHPEEFEKTPKRSIKRYLYQEKLKSE